MGKQCNKTICAALCIGAILATAGFAAPPKPIDIGTTAPDFKLPAVDGKEYALANLLKNEEVKAVVVVFTCNHCPYAVAYQDRLIAIQKDYKEKGVRLVAINSNRPDYPGDSFEAMKKRAEEKKFNFPYVQDKGNKVADAYGALVTPHIFLVDKGGKIAYRGAVDNKWNDAKQANQHYLRDAIDAVLAGKPVAKATTQAQGCTIKRVGE